MVIGEVTIVPAFIADGGERAGFAFIDFFTAQIRNRNTRMAYATAVRAFCAWCAQQMAAHESARTTKLYDRRSDKITLDEVEKIML